MVKIFLLSFTFVSAAMATLSLLFGWWGPAVAVGMQYAAVLVAIRNHCR